MPILLFIGLSIISCGGDGDEVVEALPQVIGNLPSAVDVKSTSAFIPVYEEPVGGNLELIVSAYEDILSFDKHLVRRYALHGDGVFINALDPSRTYYYAIAYYKGGKVEDAVYSKQIKSFTTQGVSIEFIGQGERNKLRLRTTAAEDWDDVKGLYVHDYSVNEIGKVKGVGYNTQYLGDGIWEASFLHPLEGDGWKAAIVGSDGHRFAETPIYRYVNGNWVAE